MLYLFQNVLIYCCLLKRNFVIGIQLNNTRVMDMFLNKQEY